MDRILRAEIVAQVKQSMMDALEVANERWLTASELCEQFQMFTPSWLKPMAIACHAPVQRWPLMAEPRAADGPIHSTR